MKKEMENVKELLRELDIVLEKVGKFRVEFLPPNLWNSKDVPSSSNRKCLNGLAAGIDNALFTAVSKYYDLRENLANILINSESVVEERTADIIKKALGKDKKNE